MYFQEKAVKYQNMPLRSEMLVTDKTECASHYGNLITSSNFCVKFNPVSTLSFLDTIVITLYTRLDILGNLAFLMTR